MNEICCINVNQHEDLDYDNISQYENSRKISLKKLPSIVKFLMQLRT